MSCYVFNFWLVSANVDRVFYSHVISFLQQYYRDYCELPITKPPINIVWYNSSHVGECGRISRSEVIPCTKFLGLGYVQWNVAWCWKLGLINKIRRIPGNIASRGHCAESMLLWRSVVFLLFITFSWIMTVLSTVIWGICSLLASLPFTYVWLYTL